MLHSLSVENYALIRRLDIAFSEGLTVITGETGAGKSILLGALGLVLGERADTGVLPPGAPKCIVEGSFHVKGYGLEGFFSDHDMDYDDLTIIRREITASGKSRAFVNDTPVNLAVVKELGERLVDIHSQHDTMYLRNAQFQTGVLDHYAGNGQLLREYSRHYSRLRDIRDRLGVLRESEKQLRLDQDYYQYLFEEIGAALLQPGEQQSLEEELNLLTHAEDISNGIMSALDILDRSDNALLNRSAELARYIGNISAFHPKLNEIASRFGPIHIELKDIARELDGLSSQVQVDPERITVLQQRLGTIYGLQRKHRVNSVEELLQIRENFENRLQASISLATEISELEEQETQESGQVSELSAALSQSRCAILDKVQGEISSVLHQLGMPNAVFRVECQPMEQPGPAGSDQVKFLFSANSGSSPSELSKVASGGELSRVMLAIKSVLSGAQLLPTMIFDEIDLGISGETAGKVGNILQHMAGNRQLIVITHLPQIAGKGRLHYYVYKTDDGKTTSTLIRALSAAERKEEIARMISGEAYSEHTLETAGELLGNNPKP